MCVVSQIKYIITVEDCNLLEYKKKNRRFKIKNVH